MSTLDLSLVQDKDVSYKIRQGNRAVISLEWLEEAEGSTAKVPVYEPQDISGNTFFTQIRTDTADNNGAIVHTFNQSADADGNFYSVDTEDARTEFVLSHKLTRSMKPEIKYFVEVKMLNAEGEPIDSEVLEIEIVPEYSRAPL